MIKTKNLSFKNFIFYKDIHIKKGTVNFITGESGCGKSTLLKLFNRTENYSSGEIYYNNKQLTEIDSIELRKKIKLISQTTFLFSKTIQENFTLFYNYCEEDNLTQERMKFFLNLTQANFPLETMCDNLSGGEKQRVYIAICLSMDAEVFMLDEPTSALDSNLSIKVIENIVAYIKEKNKTLIIISHDSKLTKKFAENTINLNGGKINE